MLFSVNKVLPLLLPLIQMASGSSIAELSSTLPSLRLVGSFSVGIEGLSAPLTFSHKLELPVAPLGQRLLNWTDPTTATPTQSQISVIAEPNHPINSLNDEAMLSDAGSTIQQIEPGDGATERSDEETANIDTCFEDENMQLVVRRQGSPSCTSPSKDALLTKKRKTLELELQVENEGSYASKRTKLELDKQPAQEDDRAGAEKRRKKHKKSFKRAKRCRHCRHCKDEQQRLDHKGFSRSR